MKVLVVDDDVVSRMVLMHLIDSCGVHDIVEAEDGAAAWEQLEGGLRPSLCFCDLRMPRLSGMELLQKIRSDSTLDAMPLVLVSSANDQDTVRDAVQAGAAGYIVKPFQPEQVRHHIDACFDICALPAEVPRDTLQRLGIDSERLLAYLTGFQGQVGAASEQVDALLARGRTGSGAPAAGTAAPRLPHPGFAWRGGRHDGPAAGIGARWRPDTGGPGCAGAQRVAGRRACCDSRTASTEFCCFPLAGKIL